MEILIITGQSGAGKSQAIACLEDIGYYCIDNLPPATMQIIIDHLKKDATIQKLAIVADVRGRQFFNDLEQSLKALKDGSQDYKILFLEASEKTLIRRFQETRRIHPLSTEGNIETAIREEAQILSGIRGMADFIIDTSNLKTSELNAEIIKNVEHSGEDHFIVSIFSFGYKYGMPPEADWVLDARFIPNPFYVESLKNLTGRNKKVKEFVLDFQETKDFIGKITGLVYELIPKYKREGKYSLTIAIGCTGGKHRSVVVAEEIAAHLRECGVNVKLSHRQLK